MALMRTVLLLVAAVGCGNALVLDDGLDTEVAMLKQQVATLQTTLNGLVESINTECKATCPSRKTVAFMAQLSASLTNPADGHVVIWDQVHTNEGSAYNSGHGIFTAPVNGTYNFNVVASAPNSPGSHSIHLLIKKNYTTAGYIFLDQNHLYWLRRSTDVVFHLSQGDEVWVEVAGATGTHTLGGCCFHSHFSGFLINAD